ncbi:orotidine 5'-phosphate decarboxylase [Weissella confusa]|uniref:orotidine-5'-phosphate decarboxylase n=1 Tax=Weissella confusa TaxID=1583 RepID=UPI0008FEA94F|nr:orotidine-5'-phosphate decarboxylase [Weissella confusa]OJF04380.1 orotidine 5'-phosphate decarboxylase [Weissella confusa]
MTKPVFIALDFPDAQTMWGFLDQFPASVRPAVKVGMELFYREGPVLVTALKEQGFTVFLDLKLYDIPNTVQQATNNVARLGVDYLTVHAAGGVRMLQAAKKGAHEGADAVGVTAPKLLAITQLTSFSEEEMQTTQLVTVSVRESVIHLAQLAAQAGVAGTISSAFETADIHANTPAGFLSITPGIRLAGDAVGDQSRVVTPARAAEMGADGIVVGRSITQATDPVAAYQLIETEFNA